MCRWTGFSTRSASHSIPIASIGFEAETRQPGCEMPSGVWRKPEGRQATRSLRSNPGLHRRDPIPGQERSWAPWTRWGPARCPVRFGGSAVSSDRDAPRGTVQVEMGSACRVLLCPSRTCRAAPGSRGTSRGSESRKRWRSVWHGGILWPRGLRIRAVREGDPRGSGMSGRLGRKGSLDDRRIARSTLAGVCAGPL